jgi:hypothetical protein
VVDDVSHEMLAALRRHSDQVREKPRELRRQLGIDSAGLGIAVGLAVATTQLTPAAAAGVTAATIAIGTKSMRDLIRDIREGRRSLAELSEHPMSILVDVLP